MSEVNKSGVPRLTLDGGRCLILFVCVWALCYIICGAINGFILYRWGDSVRAMRLAAVLQDMLVFIVPSLVSAVMVTRLPADLLCVNVRPRLNMLLIGACTMVVSIPAVNEIIAINKSMTLPQSLGGVEQWMRQAQEQASGYIEQVLGGADVGSLVVSLLLVGILAAVSEELLFRGCLQRLLMACRLNHHAAIWIAAFVFSAIHMQFFGFFPRLLLGAFFGYTLYWSGSLWTSVAMHALNNVLYVSGRWGALRHGADVSGAETMGADVWPLVVVSATLTVLGIILLRRASLRRKSRSDNF